MWNMLKNIFARIDWHILPMTVLGALLLAAIYPLMRYAPAVWFAEDGIVENIQLLILLVAVGVALCAKHEHKMFVLLAFIVLFVIIREVNGGRAIFCKLYLETEETCRWSDFKYGYLVAWIRWSFAIGVVIYALAAKNEAGQGALMVANRRSQAQKLELKAIGLTGKPTILVLDADRVLTEVAWLLDAKGTLSMPPNSMLLLKYGY